MEGEGDEARSHSTLHVLDVHGQRVEEAPCDEAMLGAEEAIVGHLVDVGQQRAG